MTLEFLLGNETATDTISCENSDGILLFALGSTHAVEYALEIDWDGDDVFNGDNEADYLLEFDISRGRERAIGAPGEGFLSRDRYHPHHRLWFEGGGCRVAPSSARLLPTKATPHRGLYAGGGTGAAVGPGSGGATYL